MPRIKKIDAREILDSRGNPTIEVTVYTNTSIGTASVPSGASRGKNEAAELRDGGKRYLGMGVKKAIKNIKTKISPILIGVRCTRQREVDRLMIELDATNNKSRIGANATLAVSLACAKVAAHAKKKHLYEYINTLPYVNGTPSLPRPFFNVINGGKHADNRLSIQEFMVSPNLGTFKQNLQAGSEIYHYLKRDLHKKYGKGTTNVGDEGGFAPEKLHKTEDALNILQKAIKDAGYRGKVGIAIDCAASEFYKSKKYLIDGKKITTEQLHNYYLKLISKYPIISIEDPFHQNDFTAFSNLRRESKIQIVGDDLTVTNTSRVGRAIKRKSCTCLLLKVNQIGTLSEAIDAAKLAKDAGLQVMVSHRSGETEDTFIADLAVGLGGGQIKAGAPCRGERTAKYNQLLRIEEVI
jgi:enolase